MRKFLIIIVTVLVLILAFFFIKDGLNLGKIHVLGVSSILDLNYDLERKLDEAETLTQQTFQSENDNLNSALTQAVTLRERYESVLRQTDAEDISEILKNEKYEIEKLWIVIGNYADEHNVKVNLQITNSSSGVSEVKDLDFTVNGSYVGITDFIYELEDDDELEFKIENFAMLPDPTNSNLKAIFTVKDVNVNISTISINNTVTPDTNQGTRDTVNQ